MQKLPRSTSASTDASRLPSFHEDANGFALTAANANASAASTHATDQWSAQRPICRLQATADNSEARQPTQE